MVNKMNFRRKRWLEWKLYSLWLSFRFCCCSGADDHFQPFVVIYCKVIVANNFWVSFAINCRSLVNLTSLVTRLFFYREVVKALVRWAGSATVQRNTETSHFEKYKGRELKFPEKDRPSSWQTLKRQASREFETHTRPVDPYQVR